MSPMAVCLALWGTQFQFIGVRGSGLPSRKFIPAVGEGPSIDSITTNMNYSQYFPHD